MAAVQPVDPGAVDDGKALGAHVLEQVAGRVNGRPALQATAVAEALYGVLDRLPPVAHEVVVDVDDDQRGPLAESLSHAIAGFGKDARVALAEEAVPDSFHTGHSTTVRSVRCPGRPPARRSPPPPARGPWSSPASP